MGFLAPQRLELPVDRPDFVTALGVELPQSLDAAADVHAMRDAADVEQLNRIH